MLAQPLDILIGTPQKLMQHAEKGNLFWGDVQYVVLDEADTMFDKGFGPEVRAVLSPLRSKAQPAKAVLVVATLSKVCTVSSSLQTQIHMMKAAITPRSDLCSPKAALA